MDEDIVLLISNRKEKGIELLIKEYAALIKAIVKKHLYNLDTYSEECINDIYLSIWNNIKSYRMEQNSFKSWIAAIAKYKAIDYKRKYLRTLDYSDIDKIDIADEVNLEKDLLNKELLEEIKGMLIQLSDKDKKILNDIFFEEISIEEASDKYKLKPSNIYNRVSRGRKRLRELILKK